MQRIARSPTPAAVAQGESARSARILACVHCEEPVRAFECGSCGDRVSRACPECHDEVRHGRIPVP